jgi:hypothetical protein
MNQQNQAENQVNPENKENAQRQPWQKPELNHYSRAKHIVKSGAQYNINGEGANYHS